MDSSSASKKGGRGKPKWSGAKKRPRISECAIGEDEKKGVEITEDLRQQLDPFGMDEGTSNAMQLPAKEKKVKVPKVAVKQPLSKAKQKKLAKLKVLYAHI